jgi:ribose transport system substrate-binding protein
MKIKPQLILMTMIIIFTLLASGCGTTATVTVVSAPTATAESPAADVATAAPGELTPVEEACKLAEKAKQIPAFVAPPNFDISGMKGKTVFLVTAVNVPFIEAIAAGFTEAATAAGAKAVVWDGKYLPSEWNKGVLSAVAQGASGIVLLGFPPPTVQESLKQATDANITVIDSMVQSDPAGLTPGVFGRAAYNLHDFGSLRADYAICNSNGKGTVLLLNDPKFDAINAVFHGAESEFGRLCPSCTTYIVEMHSLHIPRSIGFLIPTVQEYPWSMQR